MRGDSDKSQEKIEYDGSLGSRLGNKKSVFPPRKKMKYTGETIRFLVLVVLSALIVLSALQVLLLSIRS